VELEVLRTEVVRQPDDASQRSSDAERRTLDKSPGRKGPPGSSWRAITAHCVEAMRSNTGAALSTAALINIVPAFAANGVIWGT